MYFHVQRSRYAKAKAYISTIINSLFLTSLKTKHLSPGTNNVYEKKKQTKLRLLQMRFHVHINFVLNFYNTNLSFCKEHTEVSKSE